MNWTTEFPKEPGWYWVDELLGAAAGIEMMRCEGLCMYDTFQGQIYPFTLGYMFYGPIEPPTREQAKACETSKSPPKCVRK